MAAELDFDESAWGEPPSDKGSTRIKRIEVTKLFGVFSHKIDLNIEDRITVIHGPNGVGKTVVLRLLVELLKGGVDLIAAVPYERFKVELCDGAAIEVRQSRPKELNEEGPDGGIGMATLTCVIHTPNGQPKAFDLLANLAEQKTGTAAAGFLPGDWRYIAGSGWEDQEDGEVIGRTELLERYAQYMPVPIRNKLRSYRNYALTWLPNRVDVKLIRAERLRSIVQVPRQQRFRSPVERIESEKSTVEVFGKDLAGRIKTVREEHGALSANLDRSLVSRFMAGQGDQDSAQSLLERFQALDKKREELSVLGLLDISEADGISNPPLEAVSEMLANKADIFSLYVADNEEKLRVFDDIKARLQVLTSGINSRFRYKELKIDPDDGFLVESHSGEILDCTSLSSGEQHLVILFYEVLFMAQAGQLVLIDEPEISLHIEWQATFPLALREAQKLSDIDILVATHSPLIAGGAADILVPLRLDDA